MRPTGAARSGERSGSYQRRASPATKVPANYKPPHLRNNFTGNQANTRVSPGAPRVGVQRSSPNTRLYGANKTSVSPGNRFGQKPSPNRGGISNLGGQVNIQRKAPGVKIQPGQTNFLERNRQRLQQMQDRSKERAQQQAQPRKGSNSYTRPNRASPYGQNNRSNDSRKATGP